MVLVEVSLLEVAKLGLQVLEVLCYTLVLLGQPNVGLRILLLMLCVLLLHIRGFQAVSLPSTSSELCMHVISRKVAGYIMHSDMSVCFQASLLVMMPSA